MRGWWQKFKAWLGRWRAGRRWVELSAPGSWSPWRLRAGGGDQRDDGDRSQ